MKIDKRTVTDIENRIAELAASYVPEWNFDRENPDIGSTLAILFAGQMKENIDRFNQVLDTYHTEFVNMLDLSLLPAKPSCAVVLMGLIQDTIPGTGVAKGTKLLADGEQTQIFETAHNLYVTNSRLQSCFMTEKETGKILPLLGSFRCPQILPETESDEEQEETDQTEKLTPFFLFGDQGKGMEQNAVMLYHPTVFDVSGNTIFVRIEGNAEFTEKLLEGAFTFQYVTEQGLKKVESLELLADSRTLAFREPEESVPVQLDDRDYGMLAIIAEEPVKENIEITGIRLASAGEAQAPEFVNNGTTDFEPETFAPFGDTLSLFSECYIGHDRYFGKPGALVTLSFDVAYPEHRVSLMAVTEQEELKIIKRKPRTTAENNIADCYAEEISIEYFNGIGWKKLPCNQEYRSLFGTAEATKCTLEFVCPSDWQEMSVGGDKGRCLRIQLLKSDNCYMRPCVHHYPQISSMTIAYSYGDRFVQPERVRAIVGTRELDLSVKLMEGKRFLLFQRGEYTEDYLYLGFGKPMEDGPVSMLFQLEDGARYDATECRFEYSTIHGFRQMRVLDHTANMSRSGIVLFMPPSDMAMATIEGKTAYWIRLSRTEKQTSDGNPPKVLDIRLNAVEVYNIETRQEEEYYIDEVAANMVFDLGVPNILDVELWVNETNRHTEENMNRLYREMPDRVRIERDMIGNISSFYVKWKETEQFGNGRLEREYILDRLNQRILFGDGIHSEIPRVLNDAAFRMVIRCCNGQQGNVEAGSINESLENLMFIDTIYNPKCAFGGSNIESIDSALKRGANILSSRRRLVSVKDYEREILSFSDNIEKISCVTGIDRNGERADSKVTFVLLLKDYKSGSYSFHNAAANLKKHLLQSCELMIAPEELCLTEPVFVSVSVDVWAEIRDMDDGFEIQNRMKKCLEEYLDAVKNGMESGWDIGVLPKKSQIRMKLNSMKAKAAVRRIAVTATYTDVTGPHEMDIDDIEVTPFMVTRSGEHRIHIMLSE